MSHPVDKSAILAAAARLRSGGIVAFPTETVYGLGASALDPAAVARVFSAKGRPPNHPLIVHVADMTMARNLSNKWPQQAELLGASFWPGPLTLVVPRGPQIPLAVTGGGETMAVRVPSHPVAQALLAAFGGPLVAPSANRYQTLSPTTAAHVQRGLGDRVDMILDGGPTTEGIESTVVDVTQTPPRLLRPGAIAVSALRAVCATLVVQVENVPSDAHRASPGQDARHYAPRARLRLHVPRAEMCSAKGRGLIFSGAAPTSASENSFALPREPRAVAQALFATLHSLDEAGVTEIWVEALPDDEAWLAVRDRLARAATPGEK